jgi:hypothetical protein
VNYLFVLHITIVIIKLISVSIHFWLRRGAVLKGLDYTRLRDLRRPLFLSAIHQGAGPRTAARGRMDSFNQTGTLLTALAFMH